MENLGTMNPEELLQLLVGSLTCAFVIFLFIIVYVVISRQGKSAKKRRGGGEVGYWQTASPANYHAATAPMEDTATTSLTSTPLAGGAPSGGDMSSIDVSARLVGTGREAWLQEARSHPSETQTANESPFDREKEVLRLLRDPLSGQIWVQVAGMRYQDLNDVRDRAVGERVLAAITHLLRFSNGMVATDQGVDVLELPPCDAVKVPVAFVSCQKHVKRVS
jgi:hypothetical protein